MDPRARLRWGLGDFVWIWIALLVGQTVLIGIVVAAHGNPRHFEAGAGDVAALTAGSAAITVALLWFGVARRGRGSLAADLGLALRWRDWPWLAAGVLLQLVAFGAISVLHAVSGSEPKQDVAKALEHADLVPAVLGFVAVVALAPLAEELLFRGLLLRGLLRRTGAGVSVLVCGLVFAAGHLVDPSTAQFLAPLALVGVVSGILAVRSGDLSRSILLHAGFNLLSAILLLAS